MSHCDIPDLRREPRPARVAAAVTPAQARLAVLVSGSTRRTLGRAAAGLRKRMSVAPGTPVRLRVGWLATLAAVILAASCAKVSTNPGNPGPGGGGNNDGGAEDQATPSDAAGGGATEPKVETSVGTTPPDAGLKETGVDCTPVSCTPMNGRYCGSIGDGCLHELDCGACSGTQVCEKSICVGGADCKLLTCSFAGGQYCGTVGDGCGRALDCGGCGAGQTCSAAGVCVASNCMPISCQQGASKYCGTIGDGCGGTLDCGTCSSPETCGGLGKDGVCGDPNCKKITCMPAGGGQYCGVIGDGCGGTLDCGMACPNGLTCGGAVDGGVAVPNVCPGTGGSGGCSGIACNIPTCSGTATTSITGTVYDPAGKNPLYNAVVYVPNSALDDIPEGATCDRCNAKLSGNPIATALTDALGKFTLTKVPAGSNIPLVIQVGKWRRQVTLPTVNPCVTNTITDVNLTRLPRTKAEGHIPKIAITTGGSDALECLVRRIGLADAEFTTDTGTGRVHLYAGGGGTNSFSAGGTFSPATALWSNATKLKSYDIVVMSCEGSTSKYVDMKPQASIDNVAAYANSGGRLFFSHLHFYWLQKIPAFAGTASYIGNLSPPADGTTFTINQTFPKGMALAQWMNGPIVAASPALGQMVANGSEHSVTSVTAPTTEWIYLASNPSDSQKRRSEQYISFNTPVGTAEDMQCGKVVFTDIHIKASVGNTGGDDSDPAKPYPMGCKTNDMSPQDKALEFLFFDLSACVQPDTVMPEPPPVPPGLPTTPPGVPSTPPPVPPPPPPPPPPPIQ